jgi:hypothetical protein
VAAERETRAFAELFTLFPTVPCGLPEVPLDGRTLSIPMSRA